MCDCSSNVPDHKFPTSYFHFPEITKQFTSPKNIEKTKNSRKRIKSTATTSQTANVSTAISQGLKKNVPKTSNSVHLVVFREMDTDVVLLLKVQKVFK